MSSTITDDREEAYANRSNVRLDLYTRTYVLAQETRAGLNSLFSCWPSMTVDIRAHRDITAVCQNILRELPVPRDTGVVRQAAGVFLQTS